MSSESPSPDTPDTPDTPLYLLDLDLFDYTEQPFPDGFSWSYFRDPKKRMTLAMSIAGHFEELSNLCCSLKEEIGESYGVVYVGCDPYDGEALTFEEASLVDGYEGLEMGYDEPGDDNVNRWYSITEDTGGFPTFGLDDEIHLSIAERYLRRSNDTVREAQIYEALKNYFQSRVIPFEKPE